MDVTLTSPEPDLRPNNGDLPLNLENLQESGVVPPRMGRPRGDNAPTEGIRLGEFIRSLIHTQGLRREDVALRAGISKQGLNHIIAGYIKYPELPTIRGLADALGVSTLDIMAHTPLVTEQDVAHYLANQRGNAAVNQDAAWMLAGNVLAKLQPSQRRVAVQTLLATLAAMEAYHRAGSQEP
jgi:transcriptional regulator with XRE-family HTH domain